jgi:hypothetical protein
MAMLVAAMTVSLAGANEAEKAQKIVDDMTEVLDNLNADPDMAWFRSNLKRGPPPKPTATTTTSPSA